jgi:hypothetical protein
MVTAGVMDAWFGLWRISSASSEGIGAIFPMCIRFGRMKRQEPLLFHDYQKRNLW